MLLEACAFNDVGLVRVRHYENDSALMVDLEAWGAHLLTTAGDAGLTFGHARRKYVFQRDGGPTSVPLSALTEPSAGEMHAATCDPCPSLASLGGPLFTARQISGVALDANDARAGLSLGLRSSAVLALPVNGSRLVLIKYSHGDDTPPRVIVSKEVDR
jgi:hypothetical protein